MKAKSRGADKAKPRAKRAKAGVPASVDPVLDPLARDLALAIKGDHLANIWEVCHLPSRESVVRMVDQLLGILFPGVFGQALAHEADLGDYLRDSLAAARRGLTGQISLVLVFREAVTGGDLANPRPCGDCHLAEAGAAVERLLGALPRIRKMLGEDLRAAYEGDPAASSVVEVLMSYPFVEAIATHRLAHELYRAGVPLLPRMMSEVAHSRTGVDIHPGASIGPGFFIDHGTGVVIGETTVIGRGVKLYQGVTLGARSFAKDTEGNPVKGIKRHPNIEDDVTIYAGATVLGGETTIGRGSVIGGNCWVTSSVPPETVVMSGGTSRKHKE